MGDGTVIDTIRELILSDPVGIEDIPHQLVKKRKEEGFVFNVLLTGETGIGKSTLASSLFNIPLAKSSDNHSHVEVKLNNFSYALDENGVKVRLTVVETEGFGDQVNGNNSMETTLQYIESQFEAYLNEELKIKRSLSNYHDTRIHACLYLVCSTGHNLKSLDIHCMKELHDKVNVIPIVAKADCLSKEELQRFKTAIKRTIKEQGIKIYNFPLDNDGIAATNSEFNDLVPFAVAASGNYVLVNEKLARGREFPWGTMLVEDETHSEFLTLKKALIETNMEDMREKTHYEYYENFRRIRMTELGFCDPISESQSIQKLYEKQQMKHRQELLDREEQLKAMFVEKLRSKDAELEILKNSMVSKHKIFCNQLNIELENVQSLKNELEIKILSYKKGKEKHVKIK